MSVSGICSYCKENWHHCKCDQFHPIEPFTISTEEIESLQLYFYKRAGYISAEFDQPVLDFIKRLDDYVKPN
jgi:hypothetical protein